MARKIRVLIAEDHDVVREGLKFLIRTEPDFEIAGEAEDGLAAVKMAQRLKPDVVLMDFAMPNSSGLQATQTISDRLPNSKVLVLSAYSDEESVRRLFAAGALGYLTKRSAADELLQAIRVVNEGKSFLSRLIAHRLRRQSRHAFLRSGNVGQPCPLTSREVGVLQLIAEGLGNKQIADELDLSVKTVEKHRQSVMNKLDIHDVAGLTRYAISKGMSIKPHSKPRLIQPQLL
jgi:DNA-binding NarL/FixJ family response regulator